MQKSTTFSKYRLLRHQLFILRSAEGLNIQDMSLQHHLVVNLITNNPFSVKNITKRLKINHFAHFKCRQNAQSGSNLFIFQNITLQCYLLVNLRSAEWQKPIPISKINLKKHFITNNNLFFLLKYYNMLTNKPLYAF